MAKTERIAAPHSKTVALTTSDLTIDLYIECGARAVHFSAQDGTSLVAFVLQITFLNTDGPGDTITYFVPADQVYVLEAPTGCQGGFPQIKVGAKVGSGTATLGIVAV